MPDELTIEEELTPGKCWRGRDGAGRAVVLKRLPADCLRGGRPHPVVAQRMMRLREAPVAGLSQMIGVHRVDDVVVSVSEWVDGRPMNRCAADERSSCLPAVVRLVDALHRVGLVHGAVAEGNVILQPDGRVRLIDPSPLLYDDPATDRADLHALGVRRTAKTHVAETTRWHVPTLAAAGGLALAAALVAAGWVLHVAGRP